MGSQKTLNRCLCIGVAISIAICSTASAEPPEKPPLQQVEAMVMLNETGVISVTYAEPWFWEVPYYAMSLRSFLQDSLKAADADCAALSQKLMESGSLRLGARARQILDSQLENGKIKDVRLISSTLKKYSRNNKIDPQNATGSGEYTPLHGDVCSDLGDTPGYLQQMFFPPKNNPEAFFRPMCDAIETTAACLNELNLLDKINRRRQGDGDYAEVDFSPGVLSVVSGSHAGDDA